MQAGIRLRGSLLRLECFQVGRGLFPLFHHAVLLLLQAGMFFVEGTLYWKSRVIYSGELDWGSKGQDSIPVEARYFNPSKTNENMIAGLKARHLKK